MKTGHRRYEEIIENTPPTKKIFQRIVSFTLYRGKVKKRPEMNGGK